MAGCWVVVPCSLVEVYHRRFRSACCVHHQGDDDGDNISKTTVNFYRTTRRNNLEDLRTPLNATSLPHVLSSVCHSFIRAAKLRTNTQV
jgi:hypothetical protein